MDPTWIPAGQGRSELAHDRGTDRSALAHFPDTLTQCGPGSWAALKQLSMKGKKDVGPMAAYTFWVLSH